MWPPNPYGAEGTEHRVLTKRSTVKTPQKSSTVKENIPLEFGFAEKINILLLHMFKRK